MGFERISTFSVWEMTKQVFKDGDTPDDVLVKIKDEFPGWVEKKSDQYLTEKEAKSAMRGDISVELADRKGTYFIREKCGNTYQYSYINDETNRKEINKVVDVAMEKTRERKEYNERFIQYNIDIGEFGLKDAKYEVTLSDGMGRVDIVGIDGKGKQIPIEVKLNEGEDAIGQILGYMIALDSSRGIIVADTFSKRVRAVAKKYNIECKHYNSPSITTEIVV